MLRLVVDSMSGYWYLLRYRLFVFQFIEGMLIEVLALGNRGGDFLIFIIDGIMIIVKAALALTHKHYGNYKYCW